MSGDWHSHRILWLAVGPFVFLIVLPVVTLLPRYLSERFMIRNRSDP